MALHKHNSPETFTSHTDLPQKTGGGQPAPEGAMDSEPTISGGGLPVEKDRFLGHTKKQIMINDKGEMKFMGDAGTPGGPPALVDTDFKRLP